MTTAVRSRAAVVGAVVLALAVSGWQAGLHWGSRNPEPAVVLALGETVQVDGATFRLDGFETAERLPSSEPDQEWVLAPEGAMLVLVTLTTEIVSDDVDPAEHYCDPTATDTRGREWRQDSDLGYDVKRPEALTCTGAGADPIRRGEPLAVGFVFLVPADAVDGLTVDLSLGYGDGEVRLTG